MKKAAQKAAQKAVSNPLTSVFGILTIAAALAPIWAPSHVAEKVQQSALVIAGTGLVASADAKKKQ